MSEHPGHASRVGMPYAGPTAADSGTCWALPTADCFQGRRVWRHILWWFGAFLLLMAPLAGQAQTPHQAAIVVVGSDGQARSACVSFDELDLNGLELLERAKFELTYQPAGSNATVCSIDGEGCAFPRDTCFCQCQGGADCRFWSYWHLTATGWQYSSLGAPVYRVKPGSVQGWVWGAGLANENSDKAASRPPNITFEQICAAPETTLPAAVTMETQTSMTTSGLPATEVSITNTTIELATPPPTQSTPTSTPEPLAPGANLTNYALFGITLGLLLAAGAWGLLRRR